MARWGNNDLQGWVQNEFMKILEGQARDHLVSVLSLIEQNDANYEVRYGLVLYALHLAHQAGLVAGISIDPSAPQWPVVYIELPTGQISWHMPAHPVPFDGHTTEAKYTRIDNYLLSYIM